MQRIRQDEELKPRRWRVAGLAALLLFNFVAPAWADDAVPKAKKPAKKARAPVESSALDKRVGDARTVFVGEAVRIYFVDRRYQEVPYIRAAGEGPSRSAMILVKVSKVLHPANAEISSRVLVPVETNKGDIFSDGHSPYDELVARHVGKPGIWFGEIVVRTESGDDKIGRKPLEDPLTFLRAWDSKKRPVTNSLPVAQLKDVESSIRRVKLAKAAPLSEEKIAKSENDAKYMINK